jgi:hypothetical protein
MTSLSPPTPVQNPPPWTDAWSIGPLTLTIGVPLTMLAAIIGGIAQSSIVVGAIAGGCVSFACVIAGCFWWLFDKMQLHHKSMSDHAVRHEDLKKVVDSINSELAAIREMMGKEDLAGNQNGNGAAQRKRVKRDVTTL